MITRFFSVATVLLFLLMAGSMSVNAKGKTSSVRVMTFNLRRDFASDSPNHWAARKDWAARLIRKNHPGVLGTQELTASQLQDLSHLLPSFAHFGVARKDGKDRGEYCAVFYHIGKYRLLRNSTFWLSPTPEDTGSIGWDAALPRIVTWGELQEIRTGRTFFVFNTHFDHKGERARDSSAVLLLSRVRNIAADGTAFITGDFNSDSGSTTLRLLTQNTVHDRKILNPLLLTTTKLNPVWTFDGFGSTPVQSRERIDYIFGFEPARLINYRHMDQRKGSLYASDHLPVIADFTW